MMIIRYTNCFGEEGLYYRSIRGVNNGAYFVINMHSNGPVSQNHQSTKQLPQVHNHDLKRGEFMHPNDQVVSPFCSPFCSSCGRLNTCRCIARANALEERHTSHLWTTETICGCQEVNSKSNKNPSSFPIAYKSVGSAGQITLPFYHSSPLLGTQTKKKKRSLPHSSNPVYRCLHALRNAATSTILKSSPPSKEMLIIDTNSQLNSAAVSIFAQNPSTTHLKGIYITHEYVDYTWGTQGAL